MGTGPEPPVGQAAVGGSVIRHRRLYERRSGAWSSHRTPFGQAAVGRLVERRRPVGTAVGTAADDRLVYQRRRSNERRSGA